MAAGVAEYGEGLACIVVEPVAGNMGVLPPAPGFLEALRKLCDDLLGRSLAPGAVQFTGRVSANDRDELYGAASAYLCVSEHEGFSA